MSGLVVTPKEMELQCSMNRLLRNSRRCAFTRWRRVWAAQQARPDLASLSFDERFGLLVDAEWLARETYVQSPTLSQRSVT